MGRPSACWTDESRQSCAGNALSSKALWIMEMQITYVLDRVRRQERNIALVQE